MSSIRRRPLAVLLVACLLFAGAAALVTAQETTYEPNEDGTFVVYTWEGEPADQRQPGATERSYWTESVLEEIPEDEDVYLVKSVNYRPMDSSCGPSDNDVLGIDRGNTYEGERRVDDDITESVKSFGQDGDARDRYDSEFDDPEPLSTADGVQLERLRIDWYAPEDFGSPVRLTRGDRFVSAQSECLDNPDEPGWYRWASYNEAELENGTKIVPEGPAYSDWYYVCDCSDREEAVETLGPPPGEATETPTPTPDGSNGATTETPDADRTTESDGSTATDGANDETTGETSDDATTENPERSSSTRTERPTATPTAPAEWEGEVVRTPTEGDGAGPTVIASLLGLLGAAVLLRRS